MANTARDDLQEEARTRAGRMGSAIGLDRQFDEVLQFISRQYPILKTSKEGTTTEDQAYISLPGDYACRRFFVVNENLLKWSEPDPLIAYMQTNTLVSGTPSNWTIVLEESKIYMVSPPNDAYDYYFAYGRLHPRAGKKLTFTSGGTYEVLIGNTVTGATSGATGLVEDVILTSGTWAAGTGAGSIIILDDTGTFQAENLNVGSNLNVATISGAAGSADDYQHRYTYEFENAIIELLTGKCCELFQELALSAPMWQLRGERSLRMAYGKKYKTYNAPRSSFWNPTWSMR